MWDEKFSVKILILHLYFHLSKISGQIDEHRPIWAVLVLLYFVFPFSNRVSGTQICVIFFVAADF